MEKNNGPKEHFRGHEALTKTWVPGDYFPEELSIYDIVFVEKTGQIPVNDLTMPQIETFFEYCLSVVFNLSGELLGHAVVQIPYDQLKDDNTTLEDFQTLFIETGNTILGNFLTTLDQRLNIFVHLQSPLVFAPQQLNLASEGTRKARILSLLGKVFANHDINKVGYKLEYQGKTYKFHIILFTRAVVTGHD